MPTVVACYALKGGVGKTAAAVNLAWLAARDGHRTLLWDLDPQAAATFLLRSKAKVKGGTRKLLQGKSDVRDVVKETLYDGLELLPAEALYDSADLDLGETKRSDERVERVLRPLADSYDLIILDCPPGLSLLSTNIVNAARLLLVPLVPSPLSLRTLDHVVELAAGVEPPNPQVMAFFSMVDSRRPLHRDVTALVQGKYADVATATVPASAVVERMGQRRAPVEVFAPHSPAAAAFHALWMELAARLGLSATALATVES
ncbi:MAG TPA: ParA family protein [Mycobacteriales bacterium]|jgi:cellulose biosynthesis protein BcsQ|nr:ParA family protein [Mycobacteriales bacterium]